MNPGRIVSCPDREWVLVPGDDPDIYGIWSLARGEVVHVHHRLSKLTWMPNAAGREFRTS
jgi:hypothetical protein